MTVSIKAISFDFGHVLAGLDLEELGRRLVELGVAVPRDPSPAIPAAYRAHDAIVSTDGHEAGWRALVATLVAEAAGRPVNLLDPLVNALWDAQPTRNLWRWVPAPARAVVERLAARGVPMCVTSNSEGRLAALAEDVGLARYFVRIIDSGVVGVSKPDPRIFAMAVECLGVAPGGIVHIGDSEPADIVGALGAGLRAWRFDGFVPGASARPTRAELRFDDHAALTEALDRLVVT